MPTVFYIGAYRFHFYSNEGTEPPHVHVSMNDVECKYWLDPIRLAKNSGMPLHRLSKIEKLIFENQKTLLDKYNEYHNG